VQALAMGLALALAAALFAAAIAKLTRPEGIRVTLVALGVPVRRSWAAVYALIAAETAGAALLLVAPRLPLSAGLVLALFIAFAAAGALALRARSPIACACFGSGSRPLGARQILQLGPAAAAVAVVFRDAAWSAQTGTALVATALLVTAAWAAGRVYPRYAATRAMRLSLREARMATNQLELQEGEGRV
jgi:hypothetical protein